VVLVCTVSWSLSMVGCRSREMQPPPSSPELRAALGDPSPRLSAGVATGVARVEPAEFEAGQLTDLTLRFTVGTGGIPAGGGLLIDIPKAWFAMPNQLAKPVQTEDRLRPHFIEVVSSRPGVDLRTRFEDLNFDGEVERFHHVVETVVSGEPLLSGDEITVTFSNTTAPFLAGPSEVRIAVDSAGYREYRLIESAAEYVVSPGLPRELRLIAPSQAVVGENAKLYLVVLDRYSNAVQDLHGSVTIRGLGMEPEWLKFSGSSGSLSWKWAPERLGFIWPVAEAWLTTPGQEDAEGLGLKALGNPIRVFRETPQNSLYWGDLASHSAISYDGVGGRNFEYARDISHLDFFASTEHADDARTEHGDHGLTAHEWNQVRSSVERFYRPGEFVTILGYEVTLPAGHRNVYFLFDRGVPWGRGPLGLRVEELWSRSVPGEVITHIAHPARQYHDHIRRVDGPRLEDVKYRRTDLSRGAPVDWSQPIRSEIERAVEIYSIYGSAERFEPTDSLSYERLRYQPARSAKGQHFVRDAWSAGHRLGVVAVSDDHFGQPGKSFSGLTAIVATELTRESVFSALSARHTYASTGERIYVDFQIGGVGAGDVTQVGGLVSGEILAAASRDFRYVEVERFDRCKDGWTTVARWADPGKLVEVSFEDRTSGCEAIYYLRAELMGRTGGRVARLWSSPVWVVPSGGTSQNGD
jgi:hypothetical protein